VAKQIAFRITKKIRAAEKTATITGRRKREQREYKKRIEGQSRRGKGRAAVN